jgi:uncharacterized protein (DUF58 family)
VASSFISDIFPENVLKRFFPRHLRTAPVKSIKFHLRNIYIVPTVAGMGLTGVVLITLIAAINFQNSLIYVVCFWLGSLLVINILYTFRNLSGLKLELMGVEPCFAGENCLVTLRATSDRSKESIYAGWKGIDLALIGLQEPLTVDTAVSYPAPVRGRLKPPRLDIFTRYPTGLTFAWAYARMDINTIVYPAPVKLELASHSVQTGEEAEDGPSFEGGVSDFSGMRTYQSGDSPRRIHWANYARTGKLHSKIFVDYQSHDHWLTWEELPSGSVEQRLSHLCAKVLELDVNQQSFGLRIPGKTIQPNNGEVHRVACLTALALYPQTA